LKIILIINKIDKKDARPQEVLGEVEDLFLELAQDEDVLNFTTLFSVGRDGKVFRELPNLYTSDLQGNLEPLLETILEEIPNSAINRDKPFQMLISTMDSDTYVGKLCIGKVSQGTLKKGQSIALIEDDVVKGTYKASKLYTTEGLQKKEVEKITSGDIVAIAGIPELTIGQTVTTPLFPKSLPKISIEEPTIKISIGPNTSPFSGREGKYYTSRQIKERLWREKETNLGLKIESDTQSVCFFVHGRGELHLAILIETMRREGFEMEISKPEVIYKTINGTKCEPWEEVTIDVKSEFVGEVTQELGKRKGQMVNMTITEGNTRIAYNISENNLLGLRNALMTKTRGTATIHTFFLGYEPTGPHMEYSRNGSLVAVKPGVSMTYGLVNAQERGTLFIDPGVEVYEGMVIGEANRPMDIEVNVCKEKKLTNNRSSGEGVSVPLEPASPLSLEQALDFINQDELLEVTPLNVRIRKKHLTFVQRKVLKRENRV